MKKIFLGLTIFISLWALPTISFAKALKMTLTFESFGPGLKCSAISKTGRVKVKIRKTYVDVQIKKGSRSDLIYCDLPDGRRITSDIMNKAPKDTKWLAGILRANGSARLYYDDQGRLIVLNFKGNNIKKLRK